MRHGNKEKRTILLPAELDRWMEDLAMREHRSYNQQLALMIERERDRRSVEGTQLDVEALHNESLLERIR